MKRKLDNTEKTILVLLIFLLGMALANFINNGNPLPSTSQLEIEQDIIDDCMNLNLQDTSKCFRDNIMVFYSYNKTEPIYEMENGKGVLTTVDKSQSSWVKSLKDADMELIDYLRANGGKCTEWTLLYNNLCKKTDFGCGSIHLTGVEDVVAPHVYAVMYSDTEYCELDQTTVKCYDIRQ